MDYKKLADAIKLCGSTPKVDQCRECPYWAGGDMSQCISHMTVDAAVYAACGGEIGGKENV